MSATHVSERAPAKINLRLRILSLEPDGYHALDTIFQALALHDTLEAEVADATTLDVADLEARSVPLGPVEHNLVLRAARAFRDAVPSAPHVRFRLEKQIPVAAGLGGGSSDAAAALRAMNALAGHPLQAAELLELGAGLGADVPFFLCGSPLAHATGRGERLTPLPPLPPASVVVVDPGFPVSTREAFAWWDAAQDERSGGGASGAAAVSGAEAASGAGAASGATSVAALAQAGPNDFERVVFARHAELARLRDLLLEAGVAAAMLSGSGSCVFGVAVDRASWSDELDARVSALLPRAHVLHTHTLGGAPAR